MTYTYKTSGICPAAITFDIDNNIVRNVRFDGGCSGNGRGIAALCDGMTAEDVVAKLSSIDCKGRGTSCPAQLAAAVAAVSSKKK